MSYYDTAESTEMSASLEAHSEALTKRMLAGLPEFFSTYLDEFGRDMCDQFAPDRNAPDIEWEVFGIALAEVIFELKKRVAS